jgi:chromosomal replication initiator protein
MSPSIIVHMVASHFGVDAPALLGKSRVQTVSFPRKIACLLIRSHCYLSFEAIGNLFSLRDHSTILYYIRNIKQLALEDEETRNHLVSLEKQVEAWKENQRQAHAGQQAVASDAQRPQAAEAGLGS